MSDQPPLDMRTAHALAEELRRRRDTVRLTQEEVADRAGISRNHYQLLESALSDRAKRAPANPRLSTLIALSAVYGLDVSVLIVDIAHRLGGPPVEYVPPEPAEPAESDELAEPTDQAEPDELAEPTEPAEPAEPTEPTSAD